MISVDRDRIAETPQKHQMAFVSKEKDKLLDAVRMCSHYTDTGCKSMAISRLAKCIWSRHDPDL